MPRKFSNVTVADSTKASTAAKKQITARKPGVLKAGDQPKLTQAQSIAQAFTVLKNAGLLPVNIEAVPEENIERILQQAQTRESSPLPLQLWAASAGINLDDLQKSAANQAQVRSAGQSAQGGTQTNMPPRSPGTFESTLGELNALIATTNMELSALRDTLEPYLPKYLFEPQEDGEGTKEETDFDWLSTSGGSLSATQVSLNNAMNELNLLRRRVIQIRRWVVL